MAICYFTPLSATILIKRCI